MSTRKVIEPVPPSFVRRNGDWAQEGGNNTLIVMGTDRAAPGPATFDDGLGSVEAPGGGKGTGTVHVVTGRQTQNSDFRTDAAFLYLSQKTRVDDNLELSANGATNSVPAAIIKSDAVRMVARQNVRITLDGEGSYVFIDADRIEIRLGSTFLNVGKDKVTIEGGTIELGKGANIEHVILGDSFIADFLSHSHATAVGPSSTPLPPSIPKTTANLVLSKKNQVE